MTPQERQLVDDLFDRLARVEGAPRDQDAAAAIQDGVRKAPNALYALVQTVLVQDEALKRANAHIQELEQAHAGEQQQPGGFLDSMRDAVFGKDSQPRGSVPNVPPPVPNRPVWNSGQVLQQSQGGGGFDQGHHDQGYGQGAPGQGPYGQGPYGQGPYGQGAGGFGSSFGAPPFGGGGGSFLGTAAAAAAGVVGGSLLLNGIRGMMGGGHRQAFGDTTNQGGSGQPVGRSVGQFARQRCRHQRYRPQRHRLSQWRARSGRDRSPTGRRSGPGRRSGRHGSRLRRFRQRQRQRLRLSPKLIQKRNGRLTGGHFCLHGFVLAA